jgi:polyisoprenoid-binding protein YceI
MPRSMYRLLAVGRAVLAAPGLLILCLPAGGAAWAAPVTYTIDPDHTHPAFEVDHYGISTWRGMFRHTSGTVVLDADAGSGSVDVTIDTASVDLGHDELNKMVVDSSAPPILQADRYPQAHYKGSLRGFSNGVPKTLDGNLTLHGITRPVALTILKFRCLPDHPVQHREVCGADAIGTFNRADFGITVGQRYGFDMEVTLRIQVEAIRDSSKPASP